MRQIPAIAFATLLAFPAAGQDSGLSAEQPSALAPMEAVDVELDEFLWLKRPIVVLADTPADPNFQEQIALLLERPDELLKRDVVLIVDTNPNAGTEIRTRLRPRGFMLTLIGKDGRVNLRKPFPWNVREITHAMDKWPLRQKEIRDAKASAAAGAE